MFRFDSCYFSSEQLKEQLETQLYATRERLSQLQQEFENSNDDKIRLMDELDEIKKRLQTAQQEKEAVQRKYQKEVRHYSNYWFGFLFNRKADHVIFIRPSKTGRIMGSPVAGGRAGWRAASSSLSGAYLQSCST